jgi:hypothetical protein
MTAAALNKTQERKASTSNGGLMLLVAIALLGVLIWQVIDLVRYENGLTGLIVVVGSIVWLGIIVGFYTLQPNEAAAITLFGNYKGTDRTPGLRWVLPWYSKKKISLRVRNVTGEKLKVNDKRGNPIEIAAVVVWRVTDTAQALFDVDHYQTFVDIQIETAVREIASHFSYDHAEHEEPTLRGDADQVSSLLREKLQERRAPWRWSSTRSTSFPSATWSRSTTSGARRWSRTFSWCCARTATPSPWSTQDRSTSSTSWPATEKPSPCASIQRSTTRSQGSPRRSCAASTPRSNASCARR